MNNALIHHLRFECSDVDVHQAIGRGDHVLWKLLRQDSQQVVNATAHCIHIHNMPQKQTVDQQVTGPRYFLP